MTPCKYPSRETTCTCVYLLSLLFLLSFILNQSFSFWYFFSCCCCFWACVLCRFKANLSVSESSAEGKESWFPPTAQSTGRTKALERPSPDQKVLFQALGVSRGHLNPSRELSRSSPAAQQSGTRRGGDSSRGTGVHGPGFGSSGVFQGAREELWCARLVGKVGLKTALPVASGSAKSLCWALSRGPAP